MSFSFCVLAVGSMAYRVCAQAHYTRRVITVMDRILTYLSKFILDRNGCSARTARDGYTEVFGSRMTYPSERVECLHANARGTS